ncbi:MAG: hypothetical protein EGR89_04295 [[Eubacterium] rectale]|nr:hypothetical protein [Agathobacter rectalis]
MQATIDISGKKVKMRASALIPRIYRFKFGRDIISDMAKLRKAFNKKNNLPEDASEEEKQEAQMSTLDLMIFENAAYCMAWLADSSIPDSPDAWLDQFEMFSIYEILPQILELWDLSNQTTAIPKKK